MVSDRVVVDRWIEGDRVIVSNRGGESGLRVFGGSLPAFARSFFEGVDAPFTLAAVVSHGKVFVVDLLFYRGVTRRLPWYKRQKMLRRNFDWGRFVKETYPLVVERGSGEFEGAVRVCSKTPFSKGVIFKEYEGGFPGVIGRLPKDEVVL